MRTAALVAVIAALAGGVDGGDGARAQGAPSRQWRPEERVLLTDLSRVTAVAVTQSYVFAATREALAVYDRGWGSLRETLGRADGFPGTVTAMVADPSDDTAWMAGNGTWAAYHPFGRRFDTGVLPGFADLVVLAAGDPSQGAYFRTQSGWFFVRKNAGGAEFAPAGPPPGRRIAPLTQRDLLAQAPGLDAVRLSIERDDQLRMTPMTAAALSSVRGEAYVGTDGNGVFRVDLTSYRADRLPAGLLGTATGAVAVERDQVCAGTDARAGSIRRGVTCFRQDFADFHYLTGGNPLAGLPGTEVRRVALTRSAVWAATNAGLLRLPRGGGAARQFLERDGLPSGDVYALAPAPDGQWVGTSLGLAVAPDDGARAPAERVASIGAGVLALAVTDDTLWIGSAAGLLVLMPGQSTPLVVQPDVPSFRAPFVALAVKGDTILAATTTRIALRTGGEWRLLDPPGTPIGRFTAAAADAQGFWLGGDQGLAFYQPGTGVWRALTSTGDLPLPVMDVAAGGDYVWVATPGGLVRFLRRVLAP